jgi:hypothetical protein
MKAIFLFIATLFFTTLSGQVNNTDSLYAKRGRYYQQGKKLKPKELKSILLSTPESAVYYKKYKTATIIAVSSVPIAFLFALLATQKSGDIVYRKNNENKILMLSITGLLFNINTFYFFLHGNRQYKQSIKAYNRTKSLVVL